MSTNQNLTQTSIVKDPTYVEGPAKAFSTRITSLLDPSKIEVDPSKFQQQVAGLSPLQQQAAQQALVDQAGQMANAPLVDPTKNASLNAATQPPEE